MPDNLPKRLILGNGEQYVTPADKKSRGRASEMPRSYAEARELVRAQVQNALRVVRELPKEKRLRDEAVLSLRLHPDVMAKSYDPKGIFAEVRDLENVGSRTYRVSAGDVARTKRIKRQLEEHVEIVTGRVVFVRSNEQGFRRLIQALDRPKGRLTAEFRNDVQRIERFDTLSTSEQLLGFSPDWREGRVELIFHPSRHGPDVQMSFLKELFGDQLAIAAKLNVVQYPSGPTFVSCRLTRTLLDLVAGANPLRNAHPFVFGGFETLRSAPGFPAPLAPISDGRSSIKIGMFDGGIDPNHPLLKGYAEEDSILSIRTTPDPDSVAHGIAVAGAILHGPLNDKDTKQPLPTPPVSVVSFRVLPTSDAADIDLYESIDTIEKVVPARKDLTTYNLSFGPRGPILDDTISRFTYSLDALAAAHKVTFLVAAGNDGDAGEGLNRIQVPSDLVNGIGVGAYTIREGQIVHAPYSCIGPGRECGKMKPDIVAFGGCDQTPFHLVSANAGQKVLSCGTSFSVTIASSLTAQAAASFDRSTALLGRVLVTHTAVHPSGDPDHLLGHGAIVEELSDILRCNDNEVTILFQGDLVPTKMVRLPVMVPADVAGSGTVIVKWTVAALPLVSASHPADYTSCCIEDTFYPHSEVYTFSRKEDGKQRTQKIHIRERADELTQLYMDGWTRSEFPASESGNKYHTEQERRLREHKWEPIVRRLVSKRADSIHEPFLILHAIPRNGATERFDYAAAVTISAPRFGGDLYNSVLREFNALQPIRLRSQAELRIEL
jgi:hypothetical protein